MPAWFLALHRLGFRTEQYMLPWMDLARQLAGCACVMRFHQMLNFSAAKQMLILGGMPALHVCVAPSWQLPHPRHAGCQQWIQRCHLQIGPARQGLQACNMSVKTWNCVERDVNLEGPSCIFLLVHGLCIHECENVCVNLTLCPCSRYTFTH